MRLKQKSTAFWLAALVASVVIASFALQSSSVRAGSSAHYNIDWSTFDAGGGQSSSAHYGVYGTVAQPDAHAGLHGNHFGFLQVGFWQPELPGPTAVALTRLSAAVQRDAVWPWLMLLTISILLLGISGRTSRKA